MTLNVKSMTVIIGPQASGKSITAKLLYYFKSFFQEIYRACEEGQDKWTLDKNYRNQFIEYFPRDTWSKNSFEIIYTIGEDEISIRRELGKSLKLRYSDGIKSTLQNCRKIINNYKKELEDNPSVRIRLTGSSKSYNTYIRYLRETYGNGSTQNQLFIPAGRSFFANLQSTIFSFLSDNRSLDPFLIEFGSFYEAYKRSFLRAQEIDHSKSKRRVPKEVDDLINGVLNGEYIREKEKDYLLHKDKRKVNIINASSGQQETLPLLIIIKALMLRRIIDRYGATLYIEEPEAHLFPTAQKKIVELLATLFKYTGKMFQFVITTHSPYLLSSLNNLIEAGAIREKYIYNEDAKEKIQKLNTIIPSSRQINPNSVAAYSLKNGNLKSMIDKETNLILADLLDEVSNEISVEFGDLLDIDDYE